jgi:4-amino-4-deoxy-L-arabinose transferase-like glycosyltransferase
MAIDQFLFWNLPAALGLLLKAGFGDARLNRLSCLAPIRSRAAEEGSFEIPWWGIPLILIVLYVCLFSGLGAIGLVGPDEPRYAAIARAMAETHDWVTPRLWGTPWFEKPVLYYWAAGMAMRIFGVSEFAARLPSALAGLLAVVAIAWTALRSYGLGAAWYSLLMLPTSVAMIGFSRAAGPDMLFAGLITAAMAVAVEMLQTQRPSAVLRIAFGFFLGAAVLAKGPAAVILAGGATLVWAAISRNWLAPFRFLHPLVIAVFCVTALPWYVLCALRNPDFLRVFIWQHNFERYLTPVFEHRQPFWFFLPVFLIGILPWLPVIVVMCWNAIRSGESTAEQRSPALMVACWTIFTLIFFSLSQSKLPGYILPAIPPAIFLLARSLPGGFDRAGGLPRFAIVGVGFMPLLIMGIAVAEWRLSVDARTMPSSDFVRIFQILITHALVTTALVAGFALRRRLAAAASTTALSVTLLVVISNRVILPRLDGLVSTRPASEWAIGEHSFTPQGVAVLRLPRAYQFGLNYYFNTTLAEWTPENDRARVVFCGVDAMDIPKLPGGIRQWFPATPDGKVFVVILKPQSAR